MTVLDGQYAYRGLVFGRGTELEVAVVEGLGGLSVRSGDQPLPRNDGSVPGPHFVEAATPIIEFVSLGGTPEREALSRVLTAAFARQQTPQPLEWKDDGYPSRLVYARPLQVVVPRDLRSQPKVALTCADPRIYSVETRTVTVPLYSPSGGGLDFPGDFPADFSAGVALSGVAHNDGAADAWPLIRFYGPTDGGTVTSVTLANLTTGESLTVTTSILAGQILTVDNTAHVTGSGQLVVGLDGASRYGSWEQPRTPLRLPPGDSVLQFSTTGTSTAAACTVTFQDTWLS